MAYYMYGGIKIPVEKVKLCRTLLEEIKVSLAGDICELVYLDVNFGLCDNVKHKAFVRWLEDQYGFDGSQFPVTISNKQLREDMLLLDNSNFARFWHWESTNLYIRVASDAISSPAIKCKPHHRSEVLYIRLAKYKGNIGKARYSMLRRFLEDLEYVEG